VTTSVENLETSACSCGLLSRRERVGVRGYGLLIGRAPHRPSPHGERRRIAALFSYRSPATPHSLRRSLGLKIPLLPIEFCYLLAQHEHGRGRPQANHEVIE